MPKIIWSDNFEIHHPQIDEQHRKFITILNKLHDSILGGSASERMTRRTLMSLKTWASFHFEYEESLMDETSFLKSSQHKQQHTAFRAKIDKCFNQYLKGKTVLNTQLMSEMMNWLKHHILSEDQDLCGHLKEQK